MNEFQHRLQQVIEERKITASELSKLTGIDKGSLSNYINGVYEPKQDKVYKMARALNVDPGWLMTGETPRIRLDGEYKIKFDDSLLDELKSRLSPEDIELEELWETASLPARRAALAVLRSMKEE